MSGTRKKKVKIDFTFSILSGIKFDVLLIQNSILNNEATGTMISRLFGPYRLLLYEMKFH